MPASPSASARYCGRFAPSPTGLLHFGSLLTAVASYLDARHQQGQWLVRMEDLDPPREQPGAADAILRCLEAHGLHWDGEVRYQSRQLTYYHERLQQLVQAGLAYRCHCSRRQLAADGGVHSGHCLRHPPAATDACAIRLKTSHLPATISASAASISFTDLFQGQQQQALARDVGDFVIFRRDGLFAYQLAVVADDIDQQVTHVIRGCDLLDNTPRQLWLYHLLQARAPQHGHVPVIVNASGQKLSKQTFAAALDSRHASFNLTQVLALLRHPLPADLTTAPPAQQLDWASQHWQRQRLQGIQQLPEAAIAKGCPP